MAVAALMMRHRSQFCCAHMMLLYSAKGQETSKDFFLETPLPKK
jgi:hypothetical protein